MCKLLHNNNKRAHKEQQFYSLFDVLQIQEKYPQKNLVFIVLFYLCKTCIVKTSGFFSLGIVFLSGLCLDAFKLSFHVQKWIPFLKSNGKMQFNQYFSKTCTTLLIVHTIRPGRCKSRLRSLKREQADVNLHSCWFLSFCKQRRLK